MAMSVAMVTVGSGRVRRLVSVSLLLFVPRSGGKGWGEGYVVTDQSEGGSAMESFQFPGIVHTDRYHRHGMHRALSRNRVCFDSGRNYWAYAVP